MFPEKFDPWMLVGVPVFYVIMAAYAVRDFISDHRRPKSSLELEQAKDG